MLRAGSLVQSRNSRVTSSSPAAHDRRSHLLFRTGSASIHPHTAVPLMPSSNACLRGASSLAAGAVSHDHSLTHLAAKSSRSTCTQHWQLQDRHWHSRHSRTRAQASTSAAALAAPIGTAPAVVAAVPAPGGELLANLLGYAVLVGSFFRSVPQIIKIVKNNSAEGLSLTSNVMELLCYTVSVAYNVYQGYPFSSYGEIFAVWIQDMILVALIMKYMNLSAPINIASAVAFAAVSYWMCGGGCSLELLTALQLATVAVMAFGARLPQIWMNHKRGNAGMMSLTTCALNVIGNVIRIYTTAVLTNDAILMGGIYTQTVLNGILLWQCIARPAPSSGSGTDEVPSGLTPKAA